ncbi:MAG: IS110 family transposase [Bacteroidia bacterium]|nr:IS110 family transposase [Bacteroidia bacterium]
MKFNETAGIDVSKQTIDAVLHVKKIHKQFENTPKGFKTFIKWAEKNTGLSIDQILICFEHTGLYSLPLAAFLSEQQINFCMVAALEIKRSLGIVRGKNDKIDAKRIAEYAYLRRETLKAYNLPSKSVLKLQKLLSLRDRMMKQKSGYQATLKEYKAMLKRKDNQLIFKSQECMTNQLAKQIGKIEGEIKAIIKEDKRMNNLYTLIISVKGIGLVLATNFLVLTNCFTSFDNSRQFACYSGIAPFKKQSGISMNSTSRVSHYANKKMKTLLNLAASSAIQCDAELKTYYQRRITDGKSKMSTLNIIRNKIVGRVFAVIKRGSPYVPLFQHAA